MIAARHAMLRALGWLAAHGWGWVVTETPLWYLAAAVDRAGRRAAERREEVDGMLRDVNSV